VEVTAIGSHESVVFTKTQAKPKNTFPLLALPIKSRGTMAGSKRLAELNLS